MTEVRGQRSEVRWMREALRLAEKGRYTTSPNPMVGAAVVRNGAAVGRGFHREYGGAHAEIFALKDAANKARGAALVVTLEPCSTWGKTPPCVAAVIESGIRRVVIGALDPNPANHGKGIQALKKAGVQVVAGILAREVEKQNEAFFKWTRERLPFVTLKMAQSLDGKIATREGKSHWISSAAARRFVRELRAEHDAILVGKNTLLLDDPSLNPVHVRNVNLRHPQGGGGAKPWRVVLDPRLEADPRAKIFSGPQLTIQAVGELSLRGAGRRRSNPEAEIASVALRLRNDKGRSKILLPIPEKSGRLDLRNLLRQLADLGVGKLLVEGGGELAWSLLSEGLVDKAYWIVAPKIIGGRSAKTSVEGEGVRAPTQAISTKIVSCRQVGPDWIFETEYVHRNHSKFRNGR